MKTPRRLWPALLAGLLLQSLAHAETAARPARWNAAVQWLQLSDPVDASPMAALAFYPSTAPAAHSRIDGYDVAAGLDQPLARGRFPLVVVSHGNSGSPLALHDLATALAEQGFIVVAVVHPGDNDRDHSRLGALSNVYGRPLQLSAAITAAREDSRLRQGLDEGQVGVIGYSAGGETALIMAGARPDLQRLEQYCQRFPDDRDACKTRGVLIADHAELAAQQDPRIGAALLMAPLSLLFGRQALSSVQVPTLIYSGDQDQLLALEHNADALARKLPQVSDYRLLNGAGHFVFMAPCDERQQRRMPVLCEDGEGVDRHDIHQTLQEEAARFFSETLRGDQSATIAERQPVPALRAAAAR
ncbi:alpha/beta hydrolase family protein [Pseudomonas cremoricolorata]|uniref:Dienelactone hydrolase n=1 Tax=Pseudomonas cremoricolorata TaxID=157783 RepID=A0A089WNV7_9PSED|nr:dienelactone hydrolase [Pseudomonas cremoricolorata]AIR91000.1 dienelactone hydrolase [Pseudomonas cremoricolorata]